MAKSSLLRSLWERKMLVFTTVLVVLVGIGTILYFSSRGPDIDDDSKVEKGSIDVEVIDSGYSLYKFNDGYWEHSVGYEVRNNGNRVALVQVEFWFVDSEENRVGSGEHRSRAFYVFPDEVAGGGETAFYGTVEGVGSKEVEAVDVKFEVHSIDSGGISKFDRADIDGRVAKRIKDSAVREYETKDLLALSVNSDFSKPVDIASMGLVYRDGDGRIVGGWGPFKHVRYRDEDDNDPTGEPEIDELTIDSGSSSIELEVLFPPAAEFKRTDVYVEPFVVFDADDPKWNCFKCFD